MYLRKQYLRKSIDTYRIINFLKFEEDCCEIFFKKIRDNKKYGQKVRCSLGTKAVVSRFEFTCSLKIKRLAIHLEEEG